MELIYDDGWSTYEEYGRLRIYQNGDQYFLQTSGSCVYGSPSEYENDIEPCSYDQAIEEMLEMEETILELEDYVKI